MSAQTTDRAGRLAAATAATLGVGLFLETLRLWFPSVAFVFGRAGSTPPEQLGLFALAPFVLLFLVAPVVGRLGARRVLTVATGVLVVGRVVLQASDGGDLQLWAATVAALAGMAWVVAAVSGALARPALAVGVAGGLALDALLELALGTSSLLWVHAAVGWPVLLALLTLLALATARATPAELVLRTAAWPLLLLGPLLATHLVLGGWGAHVLVPATTGELVGGPSARVVYGLGAALVALGYALGVRYAAGTRAAVGRPWALGLALLVPGGTAVAGAGTAVGALAALVLLPFLGAAAGVAVCARGGSVPAAHARAAAGGMLLLFLTAFPYYASYDLPLGGWNGTFLLAAVAGLAVGATLAARRGSPVAASAARPGVTAAAVLGVALLVGAVTAGRVSIPAAPGGHGYPVRVALYNLHMGFDTGGRYVPEELAAVVAGQGADIVVLNEVDRGWALNGGQDVLTAVADRLDLPYVFAPAADAIWGNAILTRYPVLDTGYEILPDSGGFMVRSAVWAVLDLGGGRELGVVGTHLHHRGQDPDVRRPQARRVAEIASDLSVGGRPVVVAGDLNAPPGSPDIAPLTDRLRNAATGTPAFTYPSWDPARTIDHVLHSPDLAASHVTVPRSQASDHLAVVVTLTPAG